jgi:hypothetical protein
MFAKLKNTFLLLLAVMCFSSLAWQPAQAASFSYFFINKLLDSIARGQTYTPPATLYIGLATSSGSQSACGSEVTGTGYARVAYASSLTNWSGTQGAGSTTPSSGTSDQISNNVAIVFGSPTSNWGTVTTVCAWDASTGGDLIWFQALQTSQAIASGSQPPQFAIGSLVWSLN